MDHNLTYIQWLSIDGQWKKKRKKKRRLDIDQNEEWTRFWLMELFWICFPCGGWDIAWRSVSLCVLTWVHRQEFGDENITSGPSMTQIEKTFLSGRCHGALSRQTNKCKADHFCLHTLFNSFIHIRYIWHSTFCQWHPRFTSKQWRKEISAVGPGTASQHIKNMSTGVKCII